MRLTVPGNILLLGEYAVTEEGGLGLAMAVERRVRVAPHPWDELLVQGSWPGASVTWSPGSGGAPLVAAVVDAVCSWLRAEGRAPAWRTRLTVDSTGLFGADGRKLGLGSSAAVAVGIACGLLEAAGVPPRARDAAATGIALAAHRAAQGGIGSGYDVLCSFHGGLGVVRGGERPSWEPWVPSLPLDVAVFPGTAPVATPGAVRRYRAWKEGDPVSARDFLRESNARVAAFLAADTDADRLAALAAYRGLCVALGDAIGVPARIGVPDGVDAARCKTLGAGNELGVCLLADGGAPLPPTLLPAPLAATGVAWSP